MLGASLSHIHVLRGQQITDWGVIKQAQQRDATSKDPAQKIQTFEFSNWDQSLGPQIVLGT